MHQNDGDRTHPLVVEKHSAFGIQRYGTVHADEIVDSLGAELLLQIYY